ncbi:hypothetical protein ACQCQ7_19085, partial [Ralstonia pseudosolanacearum]|uniref:hypothetical protein n=1 Tax=Ralstonia pseudosolanacearum TaxID=1310165 RepID=UPI003CE6E42B
MPIGPSAIPMAGMRRARRTGLRHNDGPSPPGITARTRGALPMNPRPLLRALIRTVAACVLAGAAA